MIDNRMTKGSDRMKCECCEQNLSFRWSDTHGVGVCIACGMPYTIIHYDENKNRVDKSPEVALSAEGVDIAKRYWAETHRRVYPACYDMGFLGGRDSYSGATRGDVDAFNEWYGRNVPARESA